MNFNKELLKAYIKNMGISEGRLANMIGINFTTFSHKMNGKTQWKLNEIQQLIDILKIADYENVFQLISGGT